MRPTILAYSYDSIKPIVDIPFHPQWGIRAQAHECPQPQLSCYSAVTAQEPTA